MVHLVCFRTATGDDASEEVADLDAAVELVERLRNDDRAEDVRVFAEVPLRFETYVKVSVADGDDGEAATPSVVEVAGPAGDVPVEPPPGAMPLAPVAATAPDADPASGLFHRG